MKIISLFTLLLLSANLSFAGSTKKAAKNKIIMPNVTVKKALKLMAHQKTLKSVVGLMQSRLSKEDGEILLKAIKKTGWDMNAPYPIKMVQDYIVVKNLGKMQLRLNGRELTLRNTVVLRYDENKTYGENVTAFAKKISAATKTANSWILPEAHAGFEDYQAYVEASHAAGIVKYIVDAMEKSPRGISYDSIADLLSKDEFIEKFHDNPDFNLEKILCFEGENVMKDGNMRMIMMSGKVLHIRTHNEMGKEGEMFYRTNIGGDDSAETKIPWGDDAAAFQTTLYKMCMNEEQHQIIMKAYNDGRVEHERRGTER